MKMQWKNWGLLAGLVALPALAVPDVLAQPDEDPPEVAARVALVQGDVSLQVNGSEEWTVPETNYPLTSGDRLYTDTNGNVAIQQGSVDVRLWHSSDVTLTNLTSEYEQIGIAQGAMRVRVYALDPGRTVEVDTPNGAVIIQRPGDYRINAYGGDDGSLVQVNSGSVQITGPNVNQMVVAGQAVQLFGTDQIQIGLVDMPPFDDLDNWSIARDHRMLNSVSARYVSREIPGYDELDDNGGWEQGQYGPVWYPRNMPSGWAPYTYGHWAYVQPWGYTWIDDSHWGYAPFHYGRWVHEGPRWGWVPGPPTVRPVYSPALVAFVGGGPGLSVGVHIGGGGGGGVAAWFTLSVGEPYVPWYRCTPRYVERNNVSNVNITNIHNTTIINNYNTFITNTKTVTTVNNIHVNNVTYVNRTNVVAVPANTLSSGGRVSTSAVRLSPQQQQAFSRAPIAAPARAPAPPPVRPVLQPAKINVARPTARPVLITPRGAAPATPTRNPAILKPVALPKPLPATAIKPAVHAAPGLTVQGKPVARPVAVAAPGTAARPGAPAGKPGVTPAPVVTRPGTPTPVARPGSPTTAPAPVARPGAPIPVARPGAPTPAPTPVARPGAPGTAPAPVTARPGPPTPAPGVTRPGTPNPTPAPVIAKPGAPAVRPTPAPSTPGRPAYPSDRPATQPPARPATPGTRPMTTPPDRTTPSTPARPSPAPGERPAPPAARPLPTPNDRPAPATPRPTPPATTRPAPPPPAARPAPPARPTPNTYPAPQARPSPAHPDNAPPAKPANRPAPKPRPNPDDRQPQ